MNDAAGKDGGSVSIVRHNGSVTHAERTALLGQTPVTFWLTGLSGAGKSTLAFALERKLFDLGKTVYVLDGDNIRHGLSRDLGFSAAERSENIRRIAEVARLMNDAGLIVISAMISPYEADREIARRIIGQAAFLEIYLSTPLAVCEQRDPKGLYKSARDGHVKQFTGVSAPYESPAAPALALDTSLADLDTCLKMTLDCAARVFSSLP